MKKEMNRKSQVRIAGIVLLLIIAFAFLVMSINNKVYKHSLLLNKYSL